MTHDFPLNIGLPLASPESTTQETSTGIAFPPSTVGYGNSCRSNRPTNGRTPMIERWGCKGAACEVVAVVLMLWLLVVGAARAAIVVVVVGVVADGGSESVLVLVVVMVNVLFHVVV